MLVARLLPGDYGDKAARIHIMNEEDEDEDEDEHILHTNTLDVWFCFGIFRRGQLAWASVRVL